MSDNAKSDLYALDLASDTGQDRLNNVFRYAQVGRCVNGVAHDVNNYLGAALAYVELLQMDTELSGQQQTMIDKVNGAFEKCSKLISSLTVIARPLTDTISIIDVDTLIRDITSLRDYAVINSKIDLQLDLAPGLPSLAANVPKLQLALLYVLLNCEETLEQCPAPRIIRIRSYREDDSLLIEVWNNGPILSETEQALVFAPYTTSKTDGHLGLGLPLARDIVHLHRGALDYTSERGFIMRLPFGAQ